jgi:PAS domain-containing protein
MTQDKDIGDSLGPPQRAEQSLRKKIRSSKDIPALSRKEAQRLVHELQVYQVELEMQNEKLRSTGQDLEESRDEYSDLYDFAPVGHFTLDEGGIIQRMNLTGAKLLGIERHFLVNAPFVAFVATAGRDAFHHGCIVKKKFAAPGLAWPL